MKVFEGLIYKAKRGYIFNIDGNNRKYNCYSPCMTGDFEIVDCWVCNKDGYTLPGYHEHGVPIHTSCLGAVINKLN